MTHVIAQGCCNDAACVPVCPVDCIHPTPDEPGYGSAEMLYIDPDTCIDCGACIEVCPVSAIHPDYDLPPEQSVFEQWNAQYFWDPIDPIEVPPESTSGSAVTKTAVDPTASARGSLRVAVVGGGPAGFYAAGELLGTRGIDVLVDMFERLPVPGGLLRHGVAPDHAQTKNVFAGFNRIMANKRFRLFANTEVGRDIGHEALASSYDAVIYAVGALSDRRLGIQGEDLPGSHSATEFVAWYNGHPDFRRLEFDLDVERAVVIGNGNVAMDVARILLSDVERLRRTDIAAHALEALATSKVREVHVIGRRGPAEAAFSSPELLGLTQLPGVQVSTDLDSAYLAAALETAHGQARNKLGLLADLPRAVGAEKRAVLSFLRSPEEVLGADGVTGVRLRENTLVADPETGRVSALGTNWSSDLSCGLLLRAVGYRASAVEGVPFDATRHVFANVRGRVLDPVTEDVLSGVYVTGWVKRGPSGVIGTNKLCAQETVANLLDDWAAGRLPVPAEGDVADRLPDAVSVAGWRAVDAHEIASGKEIGRPRLKLVSLTAQRRVALGASV